MSGALGKILANVGAGLIPKIAGEGTVNILGRQVAKSTAQKVVGGATIALASKGALDLVGGARTA